MTMGKRICLLLGVALLASLHYSVDAAANVREKHTRRLSEHKIRGSGRDLGVGDRETRSKSLKGMYKQKTRNSPLKNLQRPVPKAFDNAVLKGPSHENSEKELPGPGVTQLKVNNKKRPNQSLSDVAVTEVVENGAEHFTPVDVEVYRRELPSLEIQFNIDPSSGSATPNLADYNELSEVSEEYLDSFLSSAFEDVPVNHRGTGVFVMVNEDDPFTVDFKITLEFVIPGEVPTINFLIDILREGLETETSQAFFISKLETMSETNPFSETASFEVVSRPPVSVAEMVTGAGETKHTQIDSVDSKSKSHVLASVLAGMGCVVLVGVGMLWKKKKPNDSAPAVPGQGFSLFDKSNKNGESPNSTCSFGADEATMNYLKSLRTKYFDNDVQEQTESGDGISMEQTRSFDESEDSLCDTVDSGPEQDGVVEVEIC
mmetsp:Transcript_9648/g.23387  ORF Transcript_9648/g.23387 Transcript_9648/m.23387 type:complete len:431 (+) Transcript_9648:159-1451(+)